MSARALRAWCFVHKWTSIVCTAILLVACLTGLPLIFGDEIDEWLKREVEAPTMSPDVADLALDDLVAKVRAAHPTEHVQFIFWPPRPHVIGMGMGPQQNIGLDRIDRRFFDARTGAVLENRPPATGVMQTILVIHRELFAGSTGFLILGVMGALFSIAVVSGVVIYRPFMRKLPFGTVRRDRSRRIYWLDMHNLLGIAVAAWTLVVGLTGVMNTMEKTLFAAWSRGTTPELLAPYRDKPMPTRLSSAAEAVAAARAAYPAMRPTSIGFPQSRFATPRHYLIWMKGETPLTAHLFNTVLVDAESGTMVAARELPWYLRALELSRPLHFGDYGGLPLKILWAILDIVTIVVLASGLYLWLARGRASSEAKTEARETATREITPRETFAVPALLGALTLGGLILALLVDDTWHWIAWAAVASVPAAIAAKLRRRTA